MSIIYEHIHDIVYSILISFNFSLYKTLEIHLPSDITMKSCFGGPEASAVSGVSAQYQMKILIYIMCKLQLSAHLHYNLYTSKIIA